MPEVHCPWLWGKQIPEAASDPANFDLETLEQCVLSSEWRVSS